VSTFETRLIVVQEVVLCEKGRDLVENNSFKCLRDEWKKGYRSIIIQMCWIKSRFLKQWGYPSLLKCCGKGTSVKRGVYDVRECGYN